MKLNLLILALVVLQDASAVYNYSPPLQSSINVGAALSGAQGVAAGLRQHSPRLPGIRSREPEGLSRNLNALRSQGTQPLASPGFGGQRPSPRPSAGIIGHQQPSQGSTGQQIQQPPNSGSITQPRFPPQFPPRLPSQRRPQTPPIFQGQSIPHLSPHRLLNRPRQSGQGTGNPRQSGQVRGITPPIIEGQSNSHSPPNSFSTRLRPANQGSGEGGVPLSLLTSQKDSEQRQPPQQTGRTQLLINGQRIPFLPAHRLSGIGPPLIEGGGVPLPILTSNRGSSQRQQSHENSQTSERVSQQRQQSHSSARGPLTIQRNGVSLTRARRVQQQVIEHPDVVVNGVFLPSHHGTPVQGVVQTLQQFPRTFSVKVAPRSSIGACQAVTILEDNNNEVTKTLYKNVFIPSPPRQVVTTTIFSTIKVTDIISKTQVQTVIKTTTKLAEPSVVTVTETQTALCSRPPSRISSFGGVPLPLETSVINLDTTKLSKRISSFGGVPLPLEAGGQNWDSLNLPSRQLSTGRGSLSSLNDDESTTASNRLSRKTVTSVTGNVRGTIPRVSPRGMVRFHLPDDEYIPSIDLGFAKSQPAGESSSSHEDKAHSVESYSGSEEHSNEFFSIESDYNASSNDYSYEDILTRKTVKKEGSQRNWSQQQNSKKNINRIGGNLLGRNESEKVKVTVKDENHFETFDSFLEFLKSNDEVYIFEDEEQGLTHNRLEKDVEQNESTGNDNDSLENSSEFNENNFKLLSHIKISQDSSSNSVKVSTVLR